MDADTAIHEAARYLGNDPRVACAYLFGSRARGTADSASDYDLAVLTSFWVPATERLRLQSNWGIELGRALATDRVDLVLLEQASPLLAHRVLRDGVLLCSRDETARVRFEVAALRDYFDTRLLDEEYFAHLRTRYSGGIARG